MTILYIVTWYSAYQAPVITAGIFHHEQALELKKHCNIILYYPFGTDINRQYIFSEEKGLPIYRRLYRKNKLLRILDWLNDLRKIIKNHNIDIIHAHVAGGAGIPASIAGKVFGIPVVVTEHNPIQLSGLDNPKVKKRIEYVYRNSKKNFCVSPYLKKELAHLFPGCNFDVLYNGILPPDSLVNKEMQCKKIGYVNCAIAAAFYDKDIKGFQFLLPALRQLKEMGCKMVLHICGDGPFLAFYKAMAKELNINDCCVFYGQCNKDVVYTVFSQMDFIVSASLFESAGVSVQEALLLGKPVLVTKSGGANSLINSSCGLVVESGSVEALIDGLVKMSEKFSSFDVQEIIGYAQENFSMTNVTKKYLDVYSSLCKRKECF